MINTYRIRGGTPPNQGGRLVVDEAKKKAYWFDQDAPDMVQEASYEHILNIIQSFKDEGAVIVLLRYPQTKWEEMKMRFGLIQSQETLV